MSIGADEIIDRRRLRRKLSFWRLAALLIAAAGIAAVTYRMVGPGAGADHIAKVKIEGTITENEELMERLRRVAEAGGVKGVILSIDSPGGTTAGGEAIFDAVRKVAERKPVVAHVGTLAASAGYMIASGADHIVARRSSIVGSIGVLFQYPDLTGLMEKLGIGIESIRSSPLKAEPSPFTPTTEEERQMIRRMILDSYDWFVDLVDARRPLDREEVLALADGSLFTGRQALDNRLVDALGGEDTAKAWLVERGVASNLEIREWKPRPERSILSPFALSSRIAEWLGVAPDAALLLQTLGADRIFLDGLVSVWQPDPIGADRRLNSLNQ